MEHKHSPLSYLRSRSSRTKQAIALLGALLPVLLVGYAQFYMRERSESLQVAQSKEQVSTTDGTNQISALAAFSKIFKEGRAAVGEATSALKDFNKEFLSDQVSSDESSRVLSAPEIEKITTHE